MQFTTRYKGREQEVQDLFASTFAASEGDAEGAIIGTLVANLMADTAEDDLFLFAGEENGAFTAAVFMSRLTYGADMQTVFMLAPVAVLPTHQRKGVGQTLIRHALQEMANKGVDVAVTYGDPAYYEKVGFKPASEADLAAPVPLQYPHGWQAQRLNDTQPVRVTGPSRCVSAFADPSYW